MASSRFTSGFVGFLIGIVTGLAIAAGAAVLLSMGSSPFMDKVGLVTTNVDPAQELNGGVNPNDALNGKTPVIAQTENNNGSSSLKTITVKDPSSNESTPTQVSSDRIYFLQAGAFKNENAATERCAMLAMSAINCETKASNGLWRVFVGPYNSKVEADEILDVLKNTHNIDATIIKKQRSTQ